VPQAKSMKNTFGEGATLGVALFMVAGVLTACGGGGGSSGAVTAGTAAPAGPVAADPAPTSPDTGEVPDAPPVLISDALSGRCAAPRSGTDPATGRAYVDRPGTLDDEKRWVHDWIDETYLWYDEVPTTYRASDFSGPIPYFDVLRTTAVTASGQWKDRFHYTYDSAVWNDIVANDVSYGYGIEFALLSRAPPYDIRVAYVTPGSPAAAADVARGDRLLEADGVDAMYGTDLDTLNEAIDPGVGGVPHALRFGRLDGSTYDAILTSGKMQMTAVMNVKSIDTPTGRVGYMQFNTHSEPAEGQLIDAVNQLKTQGVTDLVLDLRYNGGGLIGVAAELAAMISAPSATDGKVFEQLKFNRKNPFHYTTAETRYAFASTSIGYSVPAGQPLPRLALSRVTVLSGPDTCSASESIVNALRGIDIPVNLVGGPTCGKPYGFFPKDNCGTTYFAVQFEGVNDKGEGDYADGFAPTCAVVDDFSRALGDPKEARLAAALQLRATGACPAAAVGANKSASALTARSAGAQLSAEARRQPYLLDSPARQNRILDPRAMPH